MIEYMYQLLERVGYTHPLHPAVTHVPVGLVIGGFIFSLGALLLRKQFLDRTAHHCIILALIALAPTIMLGFMDWQHYYAGAWLFPIKMKLFIAGMLSIFLLIAVVWGQKAENGGQRIITIYGLCLISVIGLGYFGGELVYGKKERAAKMEDGLVSEGAVIFNKRCSFCHYADRAETKVGPGFKELFKRNNLPVSGSPVTAANIRKQLKTPYGSMPPFEDLPDNQITALMSFLKTL